MNTSMWEHPATAPQLALLQAWGGRVVEPAVKVLACGDEGRGAMASVADIVSAVREAGGIPPGGGPQQLLSGAEG